MYFTKMPPKRKVETFEDNTEVPPAKKTSEEETPPISPDKGATGETTTSSENKKAGTQTGLSEVEKEAHYKEEYDHTIFKVLENIITRSPAAGWNAWIGSLKYHFVRENRSKRSEKPDFLNLDKLEALKTEQLKTSGHVLNNLDMDMRDLQVQEEFEGYLKLLRETRDCFGYGIECMVMQYITSHKGEGYYRNLCMSCSHKGK